MQQTKVSHLVVIFAVLGAIGWAITIVLQGQTGRSLPIPGLAAAAMWIFGISFALWTYFAKPRLQRQPGHKPFPPLAAARIAVLAMAASRTGAVIGGFYLGVALASVSNSSTPAGWSAMIAAFLAAIGSVLVVVSALWLESMCVARNADE
jgi:Protein of unknown function (DUF3180)